MNPKPLYQQAHLGVYPYQCAQACCLNLNAMDEEKFNNLRRQDADVELHSSVAEAEAARGVD